MENQVASKGRILAVDDTPASLRLLSDILRGEGYEVRSAINGEVALDSAISNPPELVLLDIRMPGIDGFEVSRRLKAEPGTRDVPVIFISALSETDDKVRGFTLGAVDFVTKPFQREELLARVRTHLEVYRLRNNLEALVEERTLKYRESEERVRMSLLELEAANESLRQGDLALERANRALRTLSACNQALVRAGNESELLDAICRIVVETGGYRMAWVGFPEQDEVKAVRPVAQYGDAEGYLAAVKFDWADAELGRGPTGTAIRTGTVQVNQNFLTNPAMAPWREAALKLGYQSSIALPLKGSAGILGVLTIEATVPNAFNEAEISLLQELAEDLTFGIEGLRIQVEYQHHGEVLRQGLEDFIKAIANTVEMRDPYTAGHQRRVADLAVAIAREMGLAEEAIHGIKLAATVHDLGKINIPAEILAKPTKLTDIEFLLVKNHVQAGHDIVKGIKFPWPIATTVSQHHERLDGTGYPLGLKEGQIRLESRIMAVADVVEAMASHRPYRAALGIDIALKEIERGRGTAYDSEVVTSCMRLFAEKRFEFST